MIRWGAGVLLAALVAGCAAPPGGLRGDPTQGAPASAATAQEGWSESALPLQRLEWAEDSALRGGVVAYSVGFYWCGAGAEPPRDADCSDFWEIPLEGEVVVANLTLAWSPVADHARELVLRFGVLTGRTDYRFTTGGAEEVSGESPLRIDTVGPYPANATFGIELQYQASAYAHFKQPYRLEATFHTRP